jgi:hypothetical protein
VVPPRLTPAKQKPCCDATGLRSQRHSYRYGLPEKVYTLCADNGHSFRRGLLMPGLSPLQLGGPFGFCAFARLSLRPARLSGNRFEAYSSSSKSFLCWPGYIKVPAVRQGKYYLVHVCDGPILAKRDPSQNGRKYLIFRAEFFSKLRLLDLAHCIARQIICKNNRLGRFIRRETFATKSDQILACD